MEINTFDDLIQLLEECQGCDECAGRLEVVKQHLELAKRPHRVKLNRKHAQEIRMLYKEGWSKEDLAQRYKVGVSCIKNVIYGVRWRA